jgi:hypothetical protein
MIPAFLLVAKYDFQIAAPEGFSTNFSDPARTPSGLAGSWDWFTRFYHCLYNLMNYATNLGTGQ